MMTKREGQVGKRTKGIIAIIVSVLTLAMFGVGLSIVAATGAGAAQMHTSHESLTQEEMLHVAQMHGELAKEAKAAGWKLTSFTANVTPGIACAKPGECAIVHYELLKTQVGDNGRTYTGHLTTTATTDMGAKGVVGCVLGIAGAAAQTALSDGASAVVGISEAEFAGACGVGAWFGQISSWLGLP